MTITESGRGTGARKQSLDLRDHKWSRIGRASAPFDWNVGFDIEKVCTYPTKDQGSSDACGGEAGSYLTEYLFNKGVRSARYIYSQIFYAGGGTTMRDILNLLVKKGDCAQTLCPDGQNEVFMEDKSGITKINDDDALLVKGVSYAFVNPDINSVAQAIRDNQGCLLEIEGQDGNNPNWLSVNPTSPSKSNSNPIWRHFVYAGKAQMLAGVKMICVHNSWGDDCGQNGWQWLGEDYFNSGHIIQAGVLYKPTPPSPNSPTVITPQEATIYMRILTLMQEWINLLRKGGSKLGLISAHH